MFIRRLSLLVLIISITSVLQAQSHNSYTVTNLSPFTILKNGSKINPPRPQKATKEKTTFITMDCRLNILSYAAISLARLNIYKNGKLIKKYPMKETGLIILNADSLGNWSGYKKNSNKKASIYTNGKFIKTVKIDESVLEKIVGVEDNGDVISLVTDTVKSQLVLKRNGNVISLKQLPKLNGVAEAIRVIGKDVHVSNYNIVYLVRPTPTNGSYAICPYPSTYDWMCMIRGGCVGADGTLDLNCAQKQIKSGVCPCSKPQQGSTTIVPGADCGQ
jgi:hypothetical protein